MNKALFKRQNVELIIFFVILAIGIFVRCLRFGMVPAGLNQDEAFAGYEAYSMMHYGMDTAGYTNPVYLVAWGSGMNALESYLMMPFIAIFGLTPFAIRLPQVILGVASLFVVYLTGKKLYDTKTGLCAMAMLACCPWHIMLSRWGLESNLAPGMILIATYFLLEGAENSKFLIPSAFFYGLSLYAYAAVWVIMPFILAVEIGYLIYARKIKIDVYTIISGVIILILALPLLLFVLVNMGVIGEIKTGFISIPKLLVFRASEVSVDNLAGKIGNLFDIITKQTDNLPWNYVEGYGFIGYVALIFSVVGLIVLIWDIVKYYKNKGGRYCPGIMLFINFIFPLILGMLIYVNINRINILFLPMIILAGVGVARIRSNIAIAGVALYFCLFLFFFSKTYFGKYNDEISYHFGAGLDQAIEFADTHSELVYLSGDIHYPRVLFYAQVPVTEFRNTVVYNNYPSSFLSTDSFTKYSYVFNSDDPDNSTDAAYIIGDDRDMTAFKDKGFKLAEFGRYRVAYR